MLFRKQDGTLVEIKRLDCKNDLVYYKKIMDLMMEKKRTEKKTPNVLNYLKEKEIGKKDEENGEKDEFVNAKIGNIGRILQKL